MKHRAITRLENLRVHGYDLVTRKAPAQLEESKSGGNRVPGAGIEPVQPAGFQTADWTATDAASGIYFSTG